MYKITNVRDSICSHTSTNSYFNHHIFLSIKSNQNQIMRNALVLVKKNKTKKNRQKLSSCLQIAVAMDLAIFSFYFYIIIYLWFFFHFFSHHHHHHNPFNLSERKRWENSIDFPSTAHTPGFNNFKANHYIIIHPVVIVAWLFFFYSGYSTWAWGPLEVSHRPRSTVEKSLSYLSVTLRTLDLRKFGQKKISI